MNALDAPDLRRSDVMAWLRRRADKLVARSHNHSLSHFEHAMLQAKAEELREVARRLQQGVVI